MKKKFTSDVPPTAISTVNGKWVVWFVLNDVEFSASKEFDTEEEAREVMRRVYERVTEWADLGQVWVEEDSNDVKTTGSSASEVR